MKLASAEKAPPPRTKKAKIIAWIYAVILVVMVLCQLFSFEDFVPLISEYNQWGGYGTAVMTSCLIVFCDVFALPFLLRMPLSRLMRYVSLLCSLLVPAIWLKLSIIAMGSEMNSGLFGAKIVVPTGPEQFFVSLILALLAIWAVWGLWPNKKK